MGNEKANSDRWDPDQYAKFAAERAKPGFDLIAMVAEIPGGDAVDLGCGSGELTARLHDHSRARATLGLDSSEAMLAKARPLSGKGLQFEIGDINDFAAEHDFDVVFANASLHWVPDHPQLLRRLTAALRPQGQLAVQVPANGDHPSHALADEVARQDRFAKYLREAPSPGATRCARRSGTPSCCTSSVSPPRTSASRSTATSSHRPGKLSSGQGVRPSSASRRCSRQTSSTNSSIATGNGCSRSSATKRRTSTLSNASCSGGALVENSGVREQRPATPGRPTSRDKLATGLDPSANRLGRLFTSAPSRVFTSIGAPRSRAAGFAC